MVKYDWASLVLKYIGSVCVEKKSYDIQFIASIKCDVPDQLVAVAMALIEPAIIHRHKEYEPGAWRQKANMMPLNVCAIDI